MVRIPAGDLPHMAQQRRQPPPLALPVGTLQPLRPTRTDDSQRRAETSLPVLPVITSPLVPDRVGPTEGNGTNFPPDQLHIALIIPDLAIWETLRNAAFIIQPPLWAGNVRLHVVLKNPKLTAEDIALQIALVDMGMITPEVAHLTADEQITLGWPTDAPTP